MRVGVPALCGALNRGPFVVDEEREGGRGRGLGAVWKRLAARQHRTDERAPPCGRRWHNHLARGDERSARGHLVINGAVWTRLRRHGSPGKGRINALTLSAREEREIEKGGEKGFYLKG